MRRALILFLTLTVPPIAPPATAGAQSGADPDSALLRARDAVNAFALTWRVTWQRSEAIRWGVDQWAAPPDAIQLPLSRAESTYMARDGRQGFAPNDAVEYLAHCHPFDVQEGLRRRLVPPRGFLRAQMDQLVTGRMERSAICPTWYRSAGEPPSDESVRIDDAIAEPLRSRIAPLRDTLLTLLDGVAAIAPDEPWLVGQRVRFAVDQQDADRAFGVLDRCAAREWWCLMLSGYVYHAFGSTATSDSLFQLGVAKAPAELRCRWSDLSPMLDGQGREAFKALSCAQRDSASARVWWLADPLYIERGNERRSEHYARVVLSILRSNVTVYERAADSAAVERPVHLLHEMMESPVFDRWEMREQFGGDAVQEMVLRYGWPALTRWGGAELDQGHATGYLRLPETWAGVGSGYSTAEYRLSALHTLPGWKAIERPFEAGPDEWTLSYRRKRATNPSDSSWWPREHFARRTGPITQLDHQAGMFRRERSILLAVASTVPSSEIPRARGTPMSGQLLVSTGEAATDGAPLSGRVGETAVAWTAVEAIPQIAALELIASGTPSAAARVRFGFTPPRPLSEMAPGTVEVSPPVILRAPAAGQPPPTTSDAALRMMRGSTELVAVGRIAIYWETYGLAEGEPVDISVRVESRSPDAGALRRLGNRVGIGARESGVSIQWSEPRPDRLVTTLPGRIPVQGRSVVLDISGLAGGDYAIIVSAARAGGATAVAERGFRLVK